MEAPCDLEGWRQAIRAKQHTGYRLEAIVAAIQDFRDDEVVNSLAEHLSIRLHRFLRAKVSFNHPNKGLDIIEQTHGHVIESILQPSSADGMALRVAFARRVMFRLLNTIERVAKPEPVLEEDIGTEDRLDEKIDVESILERLPEGKRRAFEMFADGVPFVSQGESITSSLGINEYTARKWVNEVRNRLSLVLA